MNQDVAGSVASQRMRTERDRFVALAFCWADFLVEADAKRTITFAAGATDAVLGESATGLVGRNLLSLIVESDRPLADQLLKVAERKGRIDNVSVRLQGQRGLTPPLSLAGYCLADFEGHFFLAFHLSGVHAASRSTGRAPRDAESGLIGPEGFHEVASSRIKELQAGGHKAQVSLLVLQDLEALRDRLTAPEQESLIRAIGATLRASSVGGDSAGIIGDGKFSLVHEADLDVLGLGRQIEDFARRTDPAGQGCAVESASIAVDEAGVSEEDLANSLLYTFNRFRQSKGEAFSLKSLSSNMTTLMAEAVIAVNAFRKVIATGDFDTAFQPIVDVNTGEIHHYEVLCRFRGTADASPYQQITFAEETGLIWQFDLAMAKKVIDWMGSAAGKPASVAVNVSGRSVGTFAYVDALHNLLRQHMWTRGKLLFEITESSRMPDLDAANKFIEGLRNENYKVCLDDFGAGAASFQYLSSLDVDIVKLDGSAVRNAQVAKKGTAFMTALIKLCGSLGVQTVAEMVDSVRGLDFIRRCGVQFAQGYLFGKPAKDIASFDPLPQRQLFGHAAARSVPHRA